MVSVQSIITIRTVPQKQKQQQQRTRQAAPQFLPMHCWILSLLLAAVVIVAAADNDDATMALPIQHQHHHHHHHPIDDRLIGPELPFGIQQWDDLVVTYVHETAAVTKAAKAASIGQQRQKQQRHLEIGDFDRFNTLFQNTQLQLPDTTVSESGLTLNIQNLICHSITIGDIQTNYTINTNTNTGQEQLLYTISAYPITSITCTADYTFEVSFLFGFDGKGTITAVAQDTLVETRMSVIGNTSTFVEGPPTTTNIDYCTTVINTNGNIDFEGATLERVLTLMRQLISNIIDREASTAICKLMSESLPSIINTFIQQTNTRMDTWSMINDTISDPLYIENTYVVPEGIGLIPFLQDTATTTTTNTTDSATATTRSSTTSVSELLVRFLQEADTVLGNTVLDPITNENDLGINVFLRKTILDENGIWNVNISQFNTFNPIVLDSHDVLTQTTIQITSIQIVGLDTLTTFAPLQIIGNYTLSNQIQFNTLSIQVGLSLRIKPSTQPDSILVNPDPNIEIVEEIVIAMDFTNITIDVAIFMAINEQKFHNLMIGSLLSTENLLPCFVSAMEGLQISGLDVIISDLSTPILTGFVAPGIDRILSQFAEAVTSIYKPTLLRTIPGLFQGPIRTVLQTRLVEGIFTVGDSSQCPIVDIENDNASNPVALDFRHLFLFPDDAKSLGAVGTVQPYGNLGHVAYNFIQDQFTDTSSDNNGLPKINQFLIKPITTSQSGVAGVVRFPKTLFDFGTTTTNDRSLASTNVTGTNGIQFRLGDIRISNIDSIVYPLEVFYVTKSATVLRNNITTGSGENALNITMRITAGIQDNINEIDVSIGVDSFRLAADINAMVDANRFLQFPIGDILNYNCWLAALFPIVLDSDGYATSDTTRSLSLVEFSSSIASLSLSTQCKTCVSPGINILPELLQIMIDTDAIGTLGDRLPSLLDSLAMSPSLQTILDRLVADAPQFCPSSPEYDMDAVKTQYDNGIGFPILSSESIDTLLYTGILAVEVAFIVFAETQRLSDIPLTSPLSLQNSFVAPSDRRLIDWTDIGNSTGLGPTADKVFEQVREYLNGGSSESSSFDFDKILEGFLGRNGTLQLDTNFEFENGGIAISLDSIQIRGLDNFTLVDILEPIGAQTLSLSSEFEMLELDLVISAKNPTSTDPTQTIAVNLSTQNVSVSVALFLAVDLDKLGALELGSLFETKSIVQCLLSTTYKFEIPQMKVSIGAFSNPTVTGLRSDTGAAATLATETLFDRFKPEILEAIPKIFDGVGKDLLSNFLDSIDEGSCQAVIREPLDGAVVDFRDLLLPQNDSVSLGGSGEAQYGNLINNIFTLVKDEMFTTDPETGIAAINSKLITGLTESQSGTPGRLFFPDDLLNSDRRVQAGGLDARVRLRVYGGYINNLNTIGTPLSILEPVKDEPNLLNNSAQIGVNLPVQLGFRLMIGISNEDSDIDNELAVSLDMESLQVLLIALIKISEKALTSFPMKDITNLQCWLATIPAPALDSRGVRVDESEDYLSIVEFMTSIADLSLNISCVKCSGPRMNELTELLSGIQGSEAVTDLANEIFSLIPTLLQGNFLQLATDRALNDARMRCPHSPSYDPDFKGATYEEFDVAKSKSSVSFFLALVIVCGVLAGLVLGIVLTTKLIVRRRHMKWIQTLESRQVMVLWQDQQRQDNTNKYISDSTKSMFNSYKAIPFWIRWMTPVLILGNIGFFLSGHISLAASVTIIASLGGQTFSEEGFFEFSVAKSTIEIWNAGGEELAILIFLFSFVWPYTKTLITLALWFVSPSTLSVERRGSILLWLDFLAKWSTIDIFVLIVTIVSFRVSVQSPDIEFLPDNFYSLDLLVAPKWGLYANLLAQIISQLSSHYIIHYHRRIVELAIKEEGQDYPDVVQTNTALIDDDGNEIDQVIVGKSMRYENNDIPMAIPDPSESIKNQLYSHSFKRPHRGESDKLVVRRMVSPLLVLSAILCIALIIVGCILPTYSVSAYGIVGVLVESGQRFTDASRAYSVITTITLLFDQAKLTGTAADFIGLGSLSIILLLSVLVAPVIQSLVLLVQWFTPLTRKRRHRLMILLEVLQAWQYAEVYLLAIIVGSWQLGPISEFMINPYCDAIKGFFAELVYYGILKEEDAQCFRTDVVIAPTFYLLFIAAIVLTLMNAFIMKAIAQYLRDKGSCGTTLASELPVEPFPRNNNKLDNIEDLSVMDRTYDNTNRNTNYDRTSTTHDDETIIRKTIHPVPVLFTDRYRWLLKRKDDLSSPSSASSSFMVSSNCSEQQEQPRQDQQHHSNSVEPFMIIDATNSSNLSRIDHGDNHNNNNNDIQTVVMDTVTMQEPISFLEEEEWESFGALGRTPPPSQVRVPYNNYTNDDDNNTNNEQQSIDDISLFTNTLDPPEY